MPADLVAELVAASKERDARVVGVTGGIAVGKSTVAAALANALGIPTVSTDGFIKSDAGPRKGYAESYDAAALTAFVDAFLADHNASAPRYSHLHYDVTSYEDITGDGLVLDGLHLGHPLLRLRDRIDLLVHLD
ncbi:MAG: type pantothenate kinase, partial [Actinomycetota bacterium]